MRKEKSAAVLEHQLTEVEVRGWRGRGWGPCIGLRLPAPGSCLSAPTGDGASVPGGCRGAAGQDAALPGCTGGLLGPGGRACAERGRGRPAAGAGEPELLPGAAAADGEGPGRSGRQATDGVPHGEHWMTFPLCFSARVRGLETSSHCQTWTWRSREGQGQGWVAQRGGVGPRTAMTVV